MKIRLFVEKKKSASGFVYFVLAADTELEKNIIISMKEDVILKITDMRKSELVNLSEKKYLN